MRPILALLVGAALFAAGPAAARPAPADGAHPSIEITSLPSDVAHLRVSMLNGGGGHAHGPVRPWQRGPVAAIVSLVALSGTIGAVLVLRRRRRRTPAG
jgi:hypothetical protein